MKRIGYIVLTIVFIVIGVNEFVRVTPNDDGIIWFWLSQKIGMRGSFMPHSVKQAPSHWTKKERDEILGHMTFSMESSSAAEEILRTKIEKGQKPTEEDTQRMVVSLNNALSEASLVTDQTLYKVHPELPERFREKYQAGLSAIARGLSDGDTKELSRGAALYQEFKNWGMEHMAAFSYPPK